MTTAEIEEREPDKELDGCWECGADNFTEIRSEYICLMCKTPYGELA